MMNSLKKLAVEMLPRRALPYLMRRFAAVRFEGDYRSWREAQLASGGYDGDAILHQVRDALLKVKKGEAAYERDSVLFDRIQYSWPLLAGLLWIASRGNNRLQLVDFGGSLGSSYFQNRQFLSHLEELRWSVIEQGNFVECGQQLFQDRQLRFYRSLDDCLAAGPADAILLSSVLPYLEEPYRLLGECLERGFQYLIVDRTPFLTKGEDDLLTVQTVSAAIYPASYPAWFFNRDKFLEFLAPRYQLIEEFDSFESFQVGGARSQSKGFIFLRRES